MEQVTTGSFAPLTPPTFPAGVLRIVSWNVNRGYRIEEITNYLQAARADLILLQETDWNANRTRNRKVAHEIAEKLGMNYAFGCEFQELSQGSPASLAYHGQATLARWPVSNPRMLRFSRQSSFWRPRWYIPMWNVFQRRLGSRMALVSEVSVAQRRLVTYNLHLESRGDDELRLQQLKEVLGDTRQYEHDADIVVAGDFNFDLRQPRASEAIAAVHFDNPFAHIRGTSTAARPRLRHARSIDFMLTRGSLQACNPMIVDSVKASDHFPLAMVLRLE